MFETILTITLASAMAIISYYGYKRLHPETFDPSVIAQTLVKRHYSQFAGKEEQTKALIDAVNALMPINDEQTILSIKHVDKALQKLAHGKTEEAKKRFAKILQDETAQQAYQEAAAAARHLGALASLTDTEEALTAYHQAVKLDPDNPQGWSYLGHLLKRIDDLDEAQAAYEKVLQWAEQMTHDEYRAIAYNNLGNLYWARGKLQQSEEMHLKSLEINKTLNRQEGIARQYHNLGILYRASGKSQRAEKMFLNSLKIYNLLEQQENMARQYDNLGNIYSILGDLPKAAEMFSKSLEIEKMLERQDRNRGVRFYRKHNDMDNTERMYLKSLEISDSFRDKECMMNDYYSPAKVKL